MDSVTEYYQRLCLESESAAAQVEAVLTAVPRGRLLMLDLDSTDREQFTRTRSYHGQVDR